MFPFRAEIITIKKQFQRRAALVTKENPIWWAGLQSLGKGLMGLPFRMLVFAFILGSIAMYGKSMLYHAYTPDLPWLLGGGGYIMSFGHLPTHDIFSWTFPDKPWVLYQWLFEVIVTWLFLVLGNQLLIRVFMVLVLALYVLVPYWVQSAKRIPMLFTVPIASAALFVAAINMSLRPMIITSVFLAVQFLLLQRHREQKLSFKTVFICLTLVYALWGNMHTGVTVGFISLGLMALGDWLEKSGIYRFEPADPTIEGQPVCISHYAMLLGATFLASLANPYGWGIYTYLANLSSQGYLNDVIIELQSPNFHYINYGYFAGLLLLFILLMSRMRRVFSAQAMLHLLVFSLATLFIQRFVVWASLFYALILPVALYHWWVSSGRNWEPFKNTVERFDIYRPLFAAVCVITVILFLWMPHPRLKSLFYAHLGSCEPFAKGIAAYQDKLKLPTDKALELPEIGSCTLAMYPDEKVFMDTRFDFYGEKFTRESREAFQVKPGWQAFLDKWGINTVLITPQWQLPYQLKQNNLYKTIYEDSDMIVLRRTKP